MSFYSSGIVTRLLDPELDNSARTEFRLNADTLYLANMRLLNVGLVKSGGTATKYNGLTGAMSCIRNITLLDGSVQLDAVRNVSQWAGFKGNNMSNTKGINMYNTLVKNERGYITEGVDSEAIVAPAKAATFFHLQSFRNAGAVTTDVNTTDVAWIDLQTLFPLLSSAKALNTSMFKNLRLVIEWQTDYDYVLLINDGAISHIQPLLVVDELVNSDIKTQMMKDMSPIEYVSLENDSIYVPPVAGVRVATPNPVQSGVYAVQGFNNKRVNRMLIQKEATQAVTYKNVNTNISYGKSASLGMPAEAWQVRLNGSSLYPGVGVDKANQTQAILTDTWGSSIQPLGGVLAYANQTTLMNKGSEQMGHANYLGFSLNGKLVKDLYITYSRKGQSDTAGGRPDTDAGQQTALYNQALRLNIWAEIQREIVFNGKGNYIVRYV